MLDDQLDLLSHIHRVERQPLGQFAPGALLVHALVIDHLAANFERHLVAGVVLQHIEDEAFVDRLLHGVEVERCRRVVGADGLRRVARATEQAQGRMLGRGGEGEVAGIAWARARALPHGQPLRLGEFLPLRLALPGQYIAQVIRRAAPGGAVRLVDDDGETAIAQALLAEDGLLRIGERL
ncbi:hypothetical protein D3C73_1095630 [compost metagenome]